MLHDRQLTQHLPLVHLEHPLIDLLPPAPRPGDIPQRRRMLMKHATLIILDVPHGVNVEKLLAVLVYHRCTLHERRGHARVVQQLRAPEHEREKREVVEPPHAARARRLELESLLETARDAQVGGEDGENERGVVCVRDEARVLEAEEEDEEGGLVPGAEVEAGGVAEGGVEVVFEFGGVGVGAAEGKEERFAGGGEFRVEEARGGVGEAADFLLLEGDFARPVVQF